MKTTLLQRLENFTQEVFSRTEKTNSFLGACSLLGLICAIFALPIIPIILTACLLSPRRWHLIALSVSLGCALGAVALILLFHHLGWSLIYQYFPEFMHYPAWATLQTWVVKYGAVSLLGISASPFPEMPALIVLGIEKPNIALVFLAVFTGKAAKYGLITWLFSHFPERIKNGFGGALDWLKEIWRR